MKNLVDEIVKSLNEDCESWSFSQYTADHKSGLSIWLGNGFLFVAMYRPAELSFNLIDKFLVLTAVNTCKKRQGLRALGIVE